MQNIFWVRPPRPWRVATTSSQPRTVRPGRSDGSANSSEIEPSEIPAATAPEPVAAEQASPPWPRRATGERRRQDRLRLGKHEIPDHDRTRRRSCPEEAFRGYARPANAEFFRCGRPWAAISISSAGDFPVLGGKNRLGLLRLTFEDTTDAGKPGAFTTAVAAEILDFVEATWDKGRRLSDPLRDRAVEVARRSLERRFPYIYYGDHGPWPEHDFPTPWSTG